jgi:VanZ family protein
MAYAGSATLAVVGDGRHQSAVRRIIGLFWICVGLLEYLQHFSPGRLPSLADVALSALGALVAALPARPPWKGASLGVT